MIGIPNANQRQDMAEDIVDNAVEELVMEFGAATAEKVLRRVVAYARETLKTWDNAEIEEMVS